MLKSPLLFAIGVLVSLMSWASGYNNAYASARTNNESLALSFALPPTSHTIAAQHDGLAQADKPTLENDTLKNDSPLVSDITAATPTAYGADSDHKDDSITEITKRTVAQDDIGVNFAATSLELPSEKRPLASNHKQTQVISNEHLVSSEPAANPLLAGDSEAAALAFEPATVAYDSLGLDDWIFEGGPNSLVAHTVGSAEGTRQWNGKRTQAYYGHKDPGNGVWNLGTFSYQHAARTPEEADEKQLVRLKNQGIQLEQQASNIGIRLSLEEKLNGLDLANQAPLAALGKGGYIERLDQAYRMHMTGFEAISWARTRAYIDPDTQAWNAPGLGNNLHSISQDQERRMAAINKALRAYNRDNNTVVALAKLDSISLEQPTSSAHPTHFPEPLTANLSASLSTLDFQLPPAEAPDIPSLNTAPAETASAQTASSNATPTEAADEPMSSELISSSEPQGDKPLPSVAPTLDSLLASTNASPAPSLALQFADTTEEQLARPIEAENLAQANHPQQNPDQQHLTQDTLEKHGLEQHGLTAITPQQPQAPVETGLITTVPSTALAQLTRDSASAALAPPSVPKVDLGTLERFEDPIGLGPLSTRPNNQSPHPEEEINKAPAQPITENHTHSPSNRSRWRIRIEDRVIDRK